jgi:hypothetical protein
MELPPYIMDPISERKRIHDRVWNLNQKYATTSVNVLTPYACLIEGIAISSMNIEDGGTSQGRSFARPCPKAQLESVFSQKQIEVKFFSIPAEPEDFYAAWQNISTVEGCLKHYHQEQHLGVLSPWVWRRYGFATSGLTFFT